MILKNLEKCDFLKDVQKSAVHKIFNCLRLSVN